MLVVGIYNGHDPAVCAIKDGEIVVNIEKERLTRTRYERYYERKEVIEVLDDCGINLFDADVIALPYTGNFLEGLEVTNDDPVRNPSGTNIEELHIDGKKKIVVYVHHHLAHAALAFFGSPFESASILTYDGGGDETNLSFGIARGGQIQAWQAIQASNVAAAFMRVGFNNYRMRKSSPHDIGSPAGKVMALAAYGESDSDIRDQLELEMNLFCSLHLKGGVSGRIFNGGEDLSDTTTPRSRDLAASIQDIAEEYLSRLVDECEKLDPSIDDLCFAGGVALNCVANSRVFEKSRFKRFYVPSAPGDGGLALGQALFVHHQVLKNPKPLGRSLSAYHGPRYSSDRIQRAIAGADLSTSDYRVSAATAPAIVDLLVDGAIVALFKGPSETGPRALGHRSLVARPDIPGLREYLNDRVKLREYYRPFAPIVLEECADMVFEPGFPHSPYMSTTAVLRADWLERMVAVSHVDRTTRPQIISRADEPWLHDLVSAMFDRTGIPAIVNTSFNRREPIVETPEEAIRTFIEMPIRALYLDGTLIERVGFREGVVAVC